MKRMIVLAAAVAVTGVLPMTLQAEPASPKVAVAADANKEKDKEKDQSRPVAKPAAPRKVAAASVKRWVDWHTGSRIGWSGCPDNPINQHQPDQT